MYEQRSASTSQTVGLITHCRCVHFHTQMQKMNMHNYHKSTTYLVHLAHIRSQVGVSDGINSTIPTSNS